MGEKSSLARRSFYRAAGLASATIVALTTFAVTAEAGTLRNWNSLSTPLTVKDDGREKGQGYGTWKIGTTTNGTRSQAWGYLRDRHANGYKVFFELQTYTNAGICFSPEYTSCQADWYYYAQQFSDFNKETWSGSSWSPEFYSSTGVSANASYARGRFRVGESNKGPDLHSGPKYTKGNKY